MSGLQEQTTSERPEELKRELLNGIYALLKGLAIHEVKNEAIERPMQQTLGALKALHEQFPDSSKIELHVDEQIILICGERVAHHFSIGEAQKEILRCFELGMVERLWFDPQIDPEKLGQFLKKWALHCSLHTKPKNLPFESNGIEIKFIDPHKLDGRVKTKTLLMSSDYALSHYFVLRKLTQEFFEGIQRKELISQKALRRELLELLEIARVTPYQLVALSLIRDHRQEAESQETQALHQAIGQAIATSLLAMSMARELELSLRDQLNLGLIGLLYNIGLIGETSILKNDRLTPAEYKKVMDSQAQGVVKLLKMQGQSRPVLERLLAIFEHSRGYRMKSASLTLESRLLRLISQYVALTSERPFRDAYLPHEAMKLLGAKTTNQEEGGLDPLLYFIFVRFMGVIPVGSLVMLSDQSKAVIYRPSGEQMGIPMIREVSEDPQARPTLRDLALESNLKIVKVLDPRREGVHIPGYFF